MSEHGLSATADAVGTVAVAVIVLLLVARILSRSRPDLRLRLPLLAAFGLRVGSAAIIGLTSLNASIRGVDEVGFIEEARALAHLPFSSHQWLAAATGHLTILGSYTAGTLHICLMALQIKLFGMTELALRSTMAMISVIGIGLIVAAVYELAGSKPSMLAAWLLAIEPANMFFSTALHKEPLLYMAVGMTALGAALMWRRPRLNALLLMAAGTIVATATATYVGWFLAAGCLVLVLHTATRRLSARARWAVRIGALVICAAVIAIPSVAQKTQSQLNGLQRSELKYARLHSRLGLGAVDFSTPEGVAVNLPRRMFDLMFRPYPWQLGDTDQRLGVVETLFVLALIVVLIRTLVLHARSLVRIATPLAYLMIFLWIAYALADANAGTGFRYRTQLVPLMIGMTFALMGVGRRSVVEEGRPGHTPRARPEAETGKKALVAAQAPEQERPPS